MRVLVWDTETTGIPLWNLPADDPSQPRMIQIAAVLYGADRRVERELVSLVKPEGWQMDDALAEKLGNGLVHARLEAEGRPVLELLTEFQEMHDAADMLVAYGARFDLKILRGELRRAGFPDRYGEKPYFCPMPACTKLCKIAPTHAMLASGRKTNKTPKLGEAISIILGRELENAHDALADCRATADLFFHLCDNGHGPVLEDAA